MNTYKNVTISQLTQKITKSYGFFILINEGKNISVVIDNEKSIDLLANYLISHPILLQKIINKLEINNSDLN